MAFDTAQKRRAAYQFAHGQRLIFMPASGMVVPQSEVAYLGVYYPLTHVAVAAPTIDVQPRLYPAGTPPSPFAEAAILASSSSILRRVEILNSNYSVFKSYDNLGVISGSVGVDSTRAERRSFELVLDNSEHDLDIQPNGLWYDKIIRIWRGVEWVDEDGVYDSYMVRIGDFLIDSADTQNFPDEVHIQGRDFTKKLLTSKFKLATTFTQGRPIEQIITTIAINGGIPSTKINIPPTGQISGKDWSFERDVARWDAMDQIAVNYNWELYFDGNGILVMRRFQDPVLSPTKYSFLTGEFGNLVQFTKSMNDTMMYNSVVVTGESQNTLPVYAIAENHEPSSPTAIERIGERVYTYTSSFIYTFEQAQQVANAFLSIHSLEAFEVTLESICFPWLEGADIIEFIDPSPAPGDPTRFLLSSFSIPLALGSMQLAAKRVTIVG